MKTLKIILAATLLFGCVAKPSPETTPTETKEPTERPVEETQTLSLPNRTAGNCGEMRELTVNEWVAYSDAVFIGEVSDVTPIVDFVYERQTPQDRIAVEDCEISEAFTFDSGIRVTLKNVESLSGAALPSTITLDLGWGVTGQWGTYPVLGELGETKWSSSSESIGDGMILGGTIFQHGAKWTPRFTPLFEVEPSSQTVEFQAEGCLSPPALLTGALRADAVQIIRDAQPSAAVEQEMTQWKDTSSQTEEQINIAYFASFCQNPNDPDDEEIIDTEAGK